MSSNAKPEQERQSTSSADEVRAAVEALLYASGAPLSLRDLTKVLTESSKEEIEKALEELMVLYRAPGRGLQIAEVAGGYQITTRLEQHETVGRLLDSKPPSRLSIPALETLAVIAYRQPITLPEIMELRGVHSAGVVRTLLEKKLIKIRGRKNVVGRPLLYGTTKEFQVRFGLKDVKDLPRLEDMAEVFGEEIDSPPGDGDDEASTAPGSGSEDPDHQERSSSGPGVPHPGSEAPTADDPTEGRKSPPDAS